MDFSRPGKPTDNAKIESFNGLLRQECLNLHWFLSLDDAKEKIAAGASLVQLYSGLIYKGPQLIKDCRKALL